MKTLSIKIAYFFIAAIITSPAYAAPSYERPVTLKASNILSPDLVKGPHHQVDEKVINDAFLNIYTLHSDYGDVQVTSTAKLMKY
ncbi:MAG: hypothetical protein KAI77_09415, partial [Gammaproteobacteria bacterium]|nr:hypothetical protein [Gammaproteobacteria bacterium]